MRRHARAAVATAAATIVLTHAPAAHADGPVGTPDENGFVGNATGGGWIPGLEEEYKYPGYEEDLAAKTALYDAYDAYLDGTLDAASFEAVEARASAELGEPIDLPSAEVVAGLAKDIPARGLDEAGPICGDGVPCPVPDERVLKIPHQAQIFNNYCGPASGAMIANALGRHTSARTGQPLSQEAMAGDAHMRTASVGSTPFASGNFTSGLNYWLRGTASGYYVQTRPTPAQFRNALVTDVLDKHAIGVGTVEVVGEYSYNAHTWNPDEVITGSPVGHWVVAHGWSNGLNTVHLKDPANSVWPNTKPAVRRPLDRFVSQYVDNGISA